MQTVFAFWCTIKIYQLFVGVVVTPHPRQYAKYSCSIEVCVRLYYIDALVSIVFDVYSSLIKDALLLLCRCRRVVTNLGIKQGTDRSVVSLQFLLVRTQTFQLYNVARVDRVYHRKLPILQDCLGAYNIEQANGCS